VSESTRTTRRSTNPGATTQAEVAEEGRASGASVIEPGGRQSGGDDASQPGYSPFDTENKDPNAPKTKEVVTPSEPPLSEEEKAEVPAAGTLVEQVPEPVDPDKGRAEARVQREEYLRHTANEVANRRLEGDMMPPTAVDAEQAAKERGAGDSEKDTPAKSASKADWVEYAVEQGADEDEAEAKTRDELIAEYGG